MNIYIETLGCDKNTVDSENAAAVLEKSGHHLIQDPVDADTIIVNTCAFIAAAKAESVDTILEMAELKKERDRLIIVSGCLAQRYADELYEEIPEADIIMGVNDYARIGEIIDEYMEKKGIRIKEPVSEIPSVYNEIADRKTVEGAVSNWLKISEGCSNACSYCVIPSIRGPYRSRTEEAIIKEAEALAAAGTKELNIIAQDVTAYGRDLYGELRLPGLLKKLCAIEGIHWIRLLYCYEDTITDELIRTIAEEEKICNYIDIPLQHINDRVLEDMNRNSTTASIRDTIERLRKAIPDMHIRTTFIVGFPGETEEEFEELQDFVDEIGFDRMGAFTYSQEENTPAAEMDGQIDEDVKTSRCDSLMEMQRRISLQKNEEKIGSVMEVLVEEIDEEGNYLGRTRFDAPEIDDGVIFTSERELRIGSFVDVEIIDAFDYDLVGKVVEN